VKLNEARDRFTHLGSGTVIGSIDGWWLIICTASHVIDDIDDIVKRDSQLPPALRSDETPQQLRERAVRALARGTCFGVLRHPELGREEAYPVNIVETSRDLTRRDTALAFIQLRQPTVTRGCAIDLGPPPDTVLVAGYRYTDRENLMRGRDGRPDVMAPNPSLTIREGILDGFRESGMLVKYPCFTHRIPIDGGMSGGPMMAQRRVPSILAGVEKAERTIIGISNSADPELRVLHPDRDRESIATGVLALFTHDVALPSGQWIHFKEAVNRGYIVTSGAEARCVAVERDAAGIALRCFVDIEGRYPQWAGG
jgi:hypothetical protein